jgi:NAD(P)-dependent dehydrogenase (short-subunit alcohol dehydrogenase family)
MTTYLVTGANSGLGLETTRGLAADGARVIMAVRDLAKGHAAREGILSQFPHAQLELQQLNLVDLDSVRALASKDLGVDVLINNAGMGSGPLRRSPEGVTEMFAANHLGHFVLSALMFERLEKSEDPRIVTVSSGFGKNGVLEFENLDGSRGYSELKAYMQSKLANALFGAELDRRLRARGSRVKSVLAHPGVVATEIQQKPTGLMKVVSRLVSALLARPAADGALASLEAARGAAVQSGDVYGPGKRVGMAAVKEPTWPSMRPSEQATTLWTRSEILGRVQFL